MSTRARFVSRVAALALPALLIAASSAMARDMTRDMERDIDRNQDLTTGSGAGLDQPAMPDAPIGHRQPRASELPPTGDSPTAEDEWINRVNRDTDSKLHICRGC